MTAASGWWHRIFGINEKGSVPVIKDLSTEEWINDSALFVDT